ncbi:MAG: Rieske (2Fe-2S) protein [Chloroflexota bacterium]|nr:Rieske (2Fe-2S) protein [Chloroflexota bacterium]MDQ6905935.1 Rieske (2Fe-2S) protein [Chloroflexota bacterium]
MQATSYPGQSRERLPVLDQRTSRRRFTRYGLFGLLGAFTATSAVATYRMLYPTKVIGFGAKVNAGTVQDVKTLLAGQKFVRNSSGRFYILPASADTAIAVYWKCVHLGCTVPAPSPALEGNIQCPCHGSLYNGQTGDLIHGPATRPLDYFPITVDNGAVIVDTGKVTTRQAFDASQATKLA